MGRFAVRQVPRVLSFFGQYEIVMVQPPYPLDQFSYKLFLIPKLKFPLVRHRFGLIVAIENKSPKKLKEILSMVLKCFMTIGLIVGMSSVLRIRFILKATKTSNDLANILSFMKQFPLLS